MATFNSTYNIGDVLAIIKYSTHKTFAGVVDSISFSKRGENIIPVYCFALNEDTSIYISEDANEYTSGYGILRKIGVINQQKD